VKFCPYRRMTFLPCKLDSTWEEPVILGPGRSVQYKQLNKTSLLTNAILLDDIRPYWKKGIHILKAKFSHPYSRDIFYTFVQTIPLGSSITPCFFRVKRWRGNGGTYSQRSLPSDRDDLASEITVDRAKQSQEIWLLCSNREILPSSFFLTIFG